MLDPRVVYIERDLESSLQKLLIGEADGLRSCLVKNLTSSSTVDVITVLAVLIHLLRNETSAGNRGRRAQVARIDIVNVVRAVAVVAGWEMLAVAQSRS